MQANTHYSFGRAPTPREVEAAMQRGRVLRSKAFHDMLKSAATGCVWAGRRLRGVFSFDPPTFFPRADAPVRATGRPSWGMPRQARFVLARRGRLL